MQAVILAAGLGLRMRPITKELPKPLIPVNGKPFLWHLLKNMQEAGFEEFVIVASYKLGMIEEFVEEYGFNAEIVDQKEVLGTGHAIASAEKAVDGDFSAVMSDNLYSPIDIRKFKKIDGFNYVGGVFHEHPQRYGNLLCKNGFVERIVEKPPEKVSDFINTGIYKFTPEIFDAMKNVEKSPRGEYEVTDAINMLCDEKKVRLIKLEDYWIDMGVPEDIKKTEDFLRSRSALR